MRVPVRHPETKRFSALLPETRLWIAIRHGQGLSMLLSLLSAPLLEIRVIRGTLTRDLASFELAVPGGMKDVRLLTRLARTFRASLFTVPDTPSEARAFSREPSEPPRRAPAVSRAT
jgi:hypothetical protein